MNDEQHLDPQTLRIMRDADPLQLPDRASPGLDTEAALRSTHARAPRVVTRLPRDRRRGRGRRVVRLAAVMACAALAIVVALNVGTSGHGSIPSASAAILAHARQALIPRPGSILEIDAVITGKGGRSEVRSWSSGSAPYDARVITTSDTGKVQTGTADAHPEIYDPGSDTIYEGGSDPVATNRTGAISWIGMLDQPGVKIDTRARLDGQPAIRIIQRRGINLNVYWMTPGTYRPLEFLNNVTGTGAPVVIRYRIWRILPGGTAVLTSLRSQHPSAQVDDDPTDFATAVRRLEH